MQLGWVLEASEHYPESNGIYCSADRNLEQIRRLFGNLFLIIITLLLSKLWLFKVITIFDKISKTIEQ